MSKTFPGLPCRYGHDGLRYTNGGNCVQCTKERATQRYVAKREDNAGIPPEFIRQTAKEKAAMALRLADIRARRTARQRRCLGLP